MPVAVVTGAAGGIGVAICSRFRAEGWTVVGLDRAWPDGSATEDDRTVDLRDAPALQELLRSLGSVDALVNNAAMMWTDPIESSNLVAFDDLYAVNVRAPFAAMQALLPVLRERQGAVINIASVHAIATSSGAAPYAASKGALVALTRSAALEFAPDVRVNAICPGAIRTPMLEEGMSRDPDMADFLVSRTPMGRVGEPEEIAETVLFLADATRSGYLTGQALVVDGGVLSRLATE